MLMPSIVFLLVAILISSISAAALIMPFRTVQTSATTTLSTTTKTIPAYEVTTRVVSNKPWEGVNGSAYAGRYELSDINDLFKSCPPEVAIIVHGWYLDEM